MIKEKYIASVLCSNCRGREDLDIEKGISIERFTSENDLICSGCGCRIRSMSGELKNKI